LARLLLLPGLGADERLFAGLDPIGLPVITHPLPVPRRRENMTRYALRVAADLDLRPEDWIGGSSFGALVAADIARRRPLAGLVLIGGALTGEAIPLPMRLLAALSSRLPFRNWRHLLTRDRLLARAFQPLNPDALQTIRAMLDDTPDTMLKEGARLLASYRPAIPVLCPVMAIHGREDRLMRAPAVPSCIRVDGAGHALVLTHASTVSEFLRQALTTPGLAPEAVA